jgi:hypothetical protein
MLPSVDRCCVCVRVHQVDASLCVIVTYNSFNLALTLISLVVCIMLWHLSQWRTRVPPPHIVDMLVNIVHKLVPCCAHKDSSSSGYADHLVGSVLLVTRTHDHAQETGSEKSDMSPASLLWAPLAGVARLVLFFVLIILYSILIFACFIV